MVARLALLLTVVASAAVARRDDVDDAGRAGIDTLIGTFDALEKEENPDKAQLDTLVAQSTALIQSMTCADFVSNMNGLLGNINNTFSEHQVCKNCTATDTCHLCSTEPVHANSVFVAALTESAFNKRCLRSMFFDQEVQDNIKAILDLYLDTFLGPDCEAKFLNCNVVYGKMVAWQHELQNYQDAAFFYDPLLDTNLSQSCPSQCKECTRQHKSYLKTGQEKFKFKCILKGAELPEPREKFECEAPRRRFTKFWEKKTWCEVQDWKQMAVRQAKVSAILACSAFVFTPNLDEDELNDAYKGCVQWQEGRVIGSTASKSLIKLAKSASQLLKGPEYHFLQTIVGLGRGAALAQLIHGSKEAGGEGDGTELGVAIASNASAIEVFRQGRSTSGAENMFLEHVGGGETWVCTTPTRLGGVLGFLGQFSRQLLRLGFLPMVVGVSITLQSAIYLVLSTVILVLTFNWHHLPARWMAYPLHFLPKLLMHVPVDWWKSLGRLFRLRDWDCDPSKYVSEDSAECVPGAYVHQTRRVGTGGGKVKVKCNEAGMMVADR